MIFAGQKTPFIIFRSKEIYYIFQNKSQNPHQFAVIMKKNRVFGKVHSWGHSNSVFKFPKILVLLCVVHLKEKKMISENWKI